MKPAQLVERTDKPIKKKFLRQLSLALIYLRLVVPHPISNSCRGIRLGYKRTGGGGGGGVEG